MDTSKQEKFSKEVMSFSDVASNCFVKASKGTFLFLLPCSGRKMKRLIGKQEFAALGSIFGFRKFGHS